MWRVRAGAEVSGRAADWGRPSGEPSGWTGRAAPWNTRRPWPPSHEVRGRGLLAVLSLNTTWPGVVLVYPLLHPLLPGRCLIPALASSSMLHVCRRSARNGLEQGGTEGDAAG